MYNFEGWKEFGVFQEQQSGSFGYNRNIPEERVRIPPEDDGHVLIRGRPRKQ